MPNRWTEITAPKREIVDRAVLSPEKLGGPICHSRPIRQDLLDTKMGESLPDAGAKSRAGEGSAGAIARSDQLAAIADNPNPVGCLGVLLEPCAYRLCHPNVVTMETAEPSD